MFASTTDDAHGNFCNSLLCAPSVGSYFSCILMKIEDCQVHCQCFCLPSSHIGRPLSHDLAMIFMTAMGLWVHIRIRPPPPPSIGHADANLDKILRARSRFVRTLIGDILHHSAPRRRPRARCSDEILPLSRCALCSVLIVSLLILPLSVKYTP